MAAGIIVAGSALSGANAAPVFYTDEAAFVLAATNAGIALSVESFESGATDLGLTVTFPGGSYVCTGTTVGGCGIRTVANGTFSTDGTSSLDWFPGSSGTGNVTFNLATPTNAFGIDVIDGFEISPFDLTLAASGGIHTYDFASDQGDLNVKFIGVIDTMQTFSTAEIDGVTSGDYLLFDRLQTGAATHVPEPGTLAIFGLGLAGLGFARRRKATA